MNLSESWIAPETGGRVAFTRTWRVVTYDDRTETLTRLYVAVYPDQLSTAYEAVFAVLERGRHNHRHARSAQLADAYGDDPWWGGKSILIDLPAAGLAETLCAQLDGALAGLGLGGPSVVAGARPFGGQTGLVFIRRDRARDVGTPEPDSRRQRLSQLLRA